MGYDLASLRKIQRSNSHLSQRRYCLEGVEEKEEREPVQKLEVPPLELMEEAEERQKEGEANLLINDICHPQTTTIEADLAALERAGKTIIASYGCT